MKYNLCSYRHGTVSGAQPIELPDDAVILVTVVSGDVGLPGWIKSKDLPRSEKVVIIYYLEPVREVVFTTMTNLPEKPKVIRRKRKKNVKA